MNTPLYVLINAVLNFALVALFVRFMFELARIDAKSPYMKAIKRMTGVVDVFARIFPNAGTERQISTAAVVLMLLVYWLNLSANAVILQESIDGITLFFVGTLQAIIRFLEVLQYIIMGSVVASWIIMLFNVSHPIVNIVMQLSEPIIAPFRRILPNMGMLDFSPIAALFGLTLAEKFIKIIGANILDKIM